jgi:hypothetical protein
VIHWPNCTDKIKVTGHLLRWLTRRGGPLNRARYSNRRTSGPAHSVDETAL